MNTGRKMRQALTSLESVSAKLNNFAMDTQDKNFKKIFITYSKQLDDIIEGLRSHINHISHQESTKVYDRQL
jgi:hypothetical protein